MSDDNSNAVKGRDAKVQIVTKDGEEIDVQGVKLVDGDTKFTGRELVESLNKLSTGVEFSGSVQFEHVDGEALLEKIVEAMDPADINIGGLPKRLQEHYNVTSLSVHPPGREDLPPIHTIVVLWLGPWPLFAVLEPTDEEALRQYRRAIVNFKNLRDKFAQAVQEDPEDYQAHHNRHHYQDCLDLAHKYLEELEQDGDTT